MTEDQRIDELKRRVQEVIADLLPETVLVATDVMVVVECLNQDMQPRIYSVHTMGDRPWKRAGLLTEQMAQVELELQASYMHLLVNGDEDDESTDHTD